MSIVRFASICDLCGSRSAEYSAFPSCGECAADICPKCTVTATLDEESGKALCINCDEEPECCCVRVDVDRDDARDCPAHGPHSAVVKRQRQAEADENFAWAEAMRPVFENQEEAK